MTLFHFKFVYSCLAFLALDTGISSSEYKPFTVWNFSFIGWQYRKISNRSLQKCVQACKSERACISVNFVDSSGRGIGFCALNGCGVEDEEDKGSSLVFTSGCLYHQLRSTEAALVKASDINNDFAVSD